jgi:hypothetical protein
MGDTTEQAAVKRSLGTAVPGECVLFYASARIAFMLSWSDSVIQSHSRWFAGNDGSLGVSSYDSGNSPYEGAKGWRSSQGEASR